MKKHIAIAVLVVVIIVAFLAGKNFNNIVNNEGNKIKNLVGVYETDSWNGNTGILVLYEDKTGQYPTGHALTWELQEKELVLTVKGTGYEKDKSSFKVLFNSFLPLEEIKAISQNISMLENVESAFLVTDTLPKSLNIQLIEEDKDDILYELISAMEGVDSIQYEYWEVEENSEHEARIMENGLVLHGEFFKKVSR